ncbi:MAG: hypothetical protein M3N51_06595 [Actinomycetota bacterium]|nr:hypothetical protein [Actinomycetota bacterium]
MSTGWLIGYVAGAAAVVVVVILLSILILSARKIARQAADIRRALEMAHGNTLGLWEVEATNQTVESITAHAAQARSALGGGT